MCVILRNALWTTKSILLVIRRQLCLEIYWLENNCLYFIWKNFKVMLKEANIAIFIARVLELIYIFLVMFSFLNILISHESSMDFLPPSKKWIQIKSRNPTYPFLLFPSPSSSWVFPSWRKTSWVSFLYQSTRVTQNRNLLLWGLHRELIVY